MSAGNFILVDPTILKRIAFFSCYRQCTSVKSTAEKLKCLVTSGLKILKSWILQFLGKDLMNLDRHNIPNNLSLRLEKLDITFHLIDTIKHTVSTYANRMLLLIRAMRHTVVMFNKFYKILQKLRKRFLSTQNIN